MKHKVIKSVTLIAASMALFSCVGNNKDTALMSDNTDQNAIVATPIDYPATRTVDQVDNYHGTEVSDPYRWLEAEKTTEVAAWVSAQNSVARPFLETLPSRDTYKERLTALWDYEKYQVPYTVNGKVFHSYNDGLQNQYVLYVSDSADGQADVLLDPNTLSDDGTVSMASYEISPKANYLAYLLSDGGTDWKTIHIKDINTKKDNSDVIEGVKFTNVAWLNDESGFFYSRYPQDSQGNWDDSKAVAIYFHQLGSPQSQDRKVFAFDDKPTWNPYPAVISKDSTLLISVFEGYQANGVYTLSLKDNDAPITAIFDRWDGRYDLIGEADNALYFESTANAPTGKVIRVDIDGKNEQTIVESKAATLNGISLLGDKLFARYLSDVKSNVIVYGLDGKTLNTLSFDDIGRVTGFYGSKDAKTTFYKLTGFTNPGAIYEYDIDTGEQQHYKTIETGVDYSQFETKQVFYPSKDGTNIPMFIVHKKGVKLDGNNKTLLYGYGGFNVSLLPSYSVSRMVWIEQGNVLAIANLRGGGEYGQQWHKAGTKLKKQNVFDDFIAGAEYLIEQGYTTPESLGIQGGSNGGLLVGAVTTQRPDLFAAALPAVGVLDMLRYHTPSANARAWSSDYGLSENKDEFEALYAYSPLHNTEAGICYPATLVTTGDHDDRVVPWHSYKYAAQLQAHQGCNKPVLLRVETRAGHGAGTPTWMRIDGYADQWAFLEAMLK
ncbi:prolyl oligopeptidase family serine peptidase [Alteromonas sp. A079]|uniref:prolyl oligopeptidase family serine peptidase n=1 Tax=Alteromonas sp. A079 TaxID=3410268 RepID=UPI003BA1407B